ncbi:predicted protein [Arabidopsis lyrata subsp. lyrata]|uniref:Predicted protein n=1 Tax=Arabidopsis lyrata subsp. lyrata TaxID=81972 RepID=D7KBY5_ARALL|nr:predicted protein [Arabidopsis lyrata subsp. lyrata]
MRRPFFLLFDHAGNLSVLKFTNRKKIHVSKFADVTRLKGYEAECALELDFAGKGWSTLDKAE